MLARPPKNKSLSNRKFLDEQKKNINIVLDLSRLVFNMM